MINCSKNTRLKELIILDKQIDKTISDIGRLSSYNQYKAEHVSMVKIEKMNFLHTLMDRKSKLIKQIEDHSKSTV